VAPSLIPSSRHGCFGIREGGSGRNEHQRLVIGDRKADLDPWIGTHDMPLDYVVGEAGITSYESRQLTERSRYTRPIGL
jgi:hypothetical protein